jgi:hypothetical protein
MIESNIQSIEELLLHDEDFPINYVDMTHPDDYKVTCSSNSEFIMHSRFGRHNRLIARVSWKISDNTYMPLSFVCDTGAPSHFYLSVNALNKLGEYNVFKTDERGTMYVKVFKTPTETFLANIEETPHVHKNANIIGLKALQKLELHVSDQRFSFNSNFTYL